MEVILLKDVDNVGRAGDVKEVTDGYGRNFLFPRKLAVPASRGFEAEAKRLKDAGKAKKGELRVQLLGSGTILRECLAAAKALESDFKIPADVLSITSFSELRREALECERWNGLHPGESARVPYVQELLKERAGPLIAASLRSRSASSA